MSRHNRRVPTSFFHRFARDVCALAGSRAEGKLVSVLEGGYSDRALTSGGIAWITGLMAAGGEDDGKVNEVRCKEWWSMENLIKVSLICLTS